MLRPLAAFSACRFWADCTINTYGFCFREGQHWASGIDRETGRPILTDVYDRGLTGETVEVWQSRGTNASLMAFNPKTGLVYVNSWEIPRIMKYTKFEFVLGAGSTGVETSFRTP